MSNKIASVLVFRGVSGCYSYSIPSHLSIEPGHQVNIPLGRSTAKGLVIKIEENQEYISLKPIIETLPKAIKVPKSLIQVILWFSNYYLCTPYKAFQTVIGTKKMRDLSKSPLENITVKPAHKLSEEQEQVFNKITNSNAKEFYLKGVTGSGKTEVYLHLAKHYIQKGKSVILLVPEIALTPQLTRHFTERFGNIVSILHSNQTNKEREISYNRLLQGQTQIAIGPRSAIFAPIKNLGLVIIDEEHDGSYKQDNHPRYDARTVAKKRTQIENAILLFGSATPSLECFYPFKRGKQQSELLELHARYNKQQLPQIHLIDIREEYKDGLPPLISKPLDEAIQDRLNKKEKVMILINRRGYSTQIVCQKCAKPYDCDHCGLSYTYHMDKSFRCHRCHIIKPAQFICKNCGSYKLKFNGTGIQKVEIELRQLFPHAKILRMDKDTVGSLAELDEMLETFKDSGDILLGTQLIAKGHHIETVTLVGVIGIDTSLNMPDFRAPEMSFQLLTQVAGRPGRGTVPGEVFIQSSQPKHYAIQNAKTHNYDSFFEEELSYRETLSYPPYSRLTNLIFSSTDTKIITTYLKKLQPFLNELKTSLQVQVIGPQPCPFEKIRNHFRWHILFKCSEEKNHALKESFQNMPKPPATLRVITDFDPIHIL